MGPPLLAMSTRAPTIQAVRRAAASKGFRQCKGPSIPLRGPLFTLWAHPFTLRVPPFPLRASFACRSSYMSQNWVESTSLLQRPEEKTPKKFPRPETLEPQENTPKIPGKYPKWAFWVLWGYYVWIFGVV